jgi:4-hydroxy-tetrahydrodipicolinate reductase
MNILLNGIGGFMGREVVKAAERGYGSVTLAGGIDTGCKVETEYPCASTFEEARELFGRGYAECLIDFSHHSCTCGLLEFSKSIGIPVVIATTGHTPEELEMIKQASETIPVFHSANMSLGVALLIDLAKRAASAMPDADIEIVEKHHNRKLDAPSGTAMMLYNEIAKVRENAIAVPGRHGQGKRAQGEIGLHSLRMGNIVGEHEVILCTNSQSISIKHEAYDRSLFAEGAIVAANYLASCRPGLYDMNDLLANK